MHIESPTRTQDPENLFYHPAGLIEVMEHTVGIHIVEAFVLEGDTCTISTQNLRQVSDSFTRQADMFWRYVNPNSVGAMFGELKQVAASTAPNFKDALAGVIAEFCDVIQPRVGRASIGFFRVQRRVIPMPLCE